MVIKTNIAGVISRVSGIPRRLNKEVSEYGGEFMRNVERSAKLRASRIKDTGELKDNITTVKTKNGWDLIVASRQGFFQEMGFEPHWIHSDQIEGSKKLTRDGFFWVKKSTPFVKPAFQKNIDKLPGMLKSATKKAIAKRGG